MVKRIPFFFFMLCVAVATCSAYTVVMKNGKTMTGTLISETDQVMVFKDDSGIQYSLKKSTLDLEKMVQANMPREEPAHAESPQMTTPTAPVATKPEASKKKARVYTKDDVEALRSKYPELSIGQPIENPEDFDNGVLKPEAYGRRIQQGATAIVDNLETLKELRDGVATAWEFAASNGKDPSEAVNALLKGEKGSSIMKGVSDELGSLGRVQESMTSPPENVKSNYDLYVQALTGLSDFQRGLREWNTFNDAKLFRSRMSDLEGQIRSAVNRIQASAPPPPSTPDSNQQNTEDQEQQP
jgi:hypothetical protein